MPKSRLMILLMIFWIAAGCQHTNPVKITQSAPQPGTAVTENSPEPAVAADQNQNENDTQSVASNDTVKEEPPDGEQQIISEGEDSAGKTEPDPAAICQAKIDQALELCNFAQQMWEEGKLEEAISNLDSAYYSILEIDAEDNPELNQQKEDVRYLISKRILEIYASRQIAVNGQHKEIPIVLNKHVQDEIKRLTGPERKFFIQSLERSGRYRPFIVAELKKAGVPEDISWLPLIESGFKIRALSSARALGIWQFIPSTGYKFGLKRNYYIDERLDPEKATLAAIAYLKELHNLFGDWTTALAAYNCGESRVLRIIRKQKINYLDNFWDLYQNLPRETSRYVPRFLATLHIIRNPEKYGLNQAHIKEPIPYQYCEIKKQVRITDIAKEIGYDSRELRDLNPELRYSILPPEPYKLKVPSEKVDIFMAKLDTIKTTYSPPPMFVYHRVRRGDTLSVIAKRYKTTVRAISRANNIGRSHRIIAGKVLKIPSRDNGPDINAIAAAPLEPGKVVRYRVKRGDNLWKIARKFGTTTRNIAAVNNLSNTRLYVGQRLDITSGKKPVYAAKDSAGTYLVCSGDSPFSIAKKHKMSLNRLLDLNRLNKHSKIFPGQTLIVE